MGKLTSISLAGNDTRGLVVSITENGDLRMSGKEELDSRDIGDADSRYAGDLEYSLIVDAEFKDTMLLQLIEERFESEAEFRDWLRKKCVPGKLRND
ncbi:MAG: hypothetical protein RRC34_16070 [Lentisphaeria bacterium]|nr:hypothetical protein [Lentisphaeria bacterium]